MPMPPSMAAKRLALTSFSGSSPWRFRENANNPCGKLSATEASKAYNNKATNFFVFHTYWSVKKLKTINISFLYCSTNFDWVEYWRKLVLYKKVDLIVWIQIESYFLHYNSSILSLEAALLKVLYFSFYQEQKSFHMYYTWSRQLVHIFEVFAIFSMYILKGFL